MFCKNCYSKSLKKVFKIGKQPISSVFFNKPKAKLKKYSLDLYLCNKCKLVQFNKLPPLDDMYGLTYGYNTSLSPLMVNHMKLLEQNFHFQIQFFLTGTDKNLFSFVSTNSQFYNITNL